MLARVGVCVRVAVAVADGGCACAEGVSYDNTLRSAALGLGAAWWLCLQCDEAAAEVNRSDAEWLALNGSFGAEAVLWRDDEASDDWLSELSALKLPWCVLRRHCARASPPSSSPRCTTDTRCRPPLSGKVGSER